MGQEEMGRKETSVRNKDADLRKFKTLQYIV